MTKKINGARTMAMEDDKFFKEAREQGYYYYCPAPKCHYRFLSISDSEHVCIGTKGKGNRGKYYPIQVRDL